LEWFHEKEYQILNLTYIFDGPFPTFYRGPLHFDFSSTDYTQLMMLIDIELSQLIGTEEIIIIAANRLQ
ncbi:MAG: hypothetical protein ACLTW7_01630, partial [Enterococcus sp.]